MAAKAKQEGFATIRGGKKMADMIKSGELVLLISPDGKRYLRALEPEGSFHTQDGVLAMAAVAASGFGTSIRTHKGAVYRILQPTLYELMKGVKRSTTIMYPKEIGYVLLKLGVGPGRRIVEAGTGSAGMTTALAWMVGDTGRVYTCEAREEFYKLAGKNLNRVGLTHRVNRYHLDIAEGFPEEAAGADALFLDVRTPWEYLDQAARIIIPGAPVGFLLPTVNQISDLLRAMENSPFGDVEVLEILHRRWKTVPDRMRPDDRMVAHTGFLVFARHQGVPAPELPEPEPEPEIEPEEGSTGHDLPAEEQTPRADTSLEG